MNEVGLEIAILSLGQILAIAEDEIGSEKARETLERHVRQVAAVIQGQSFNKPDEGTEWLLARVREMLAAPVSQVEDVALAG